MTDLYKHLGLGPRVSDGAIRQRLGHVADPKVRAACEFVLLDPRRREVYDRNHHTLTTIGQMRARMGLNLKPFWFRGEGRDFSQPMVRPTTPTDPTAVYEAAGRGRRWRKAGVGAAVALVLAIVAIVVMAYRLGGIEF